MTGKYDHGGLETIQQLAKGVPLTLIIVDICVQVAMFLEVVQPHWATH